MSHFEVALAAQFHEKPERKFKVLVCLLHPDCTTDWIHHFDTPAVGVQEFKNNNMDSVASASRHCALLFSCVIFMVSASADQKNISATVGESVTLPCRAPDNSIRAILWSRPDLEPKYILLYRDKQIDPEEQHPNFKDRVDLQDGQMKDGDVSLMIRNVMIFDSGTYECQVFMKGPNQRKRTADYITIINLTVVPVKKNITAGETVVLPCQALNANSNPNTVVEWSRADLKPKYVLLFRDKQFDPEEQHPSFKNRVDLQDRQMKDGDVSLVLKNVTINDSGTYECRVKIKTNRRKRANLDNDVISIISLSVVDPPGQLGGHTEDGSAGMAVGLSVFGILVLVVGVVVGFVIFKNSKEQKNEASS